VINFLFKRAAAHPARRINLFFHGLFITFSLSALILPDNPTLNIGSTL
jgi:hypothetical protein